MADTYTGKKITEITENTSGADTDLLVVGNRGTAAMRRFTLANLATYIRDKLASLTFSALNTSNKTLPGAINELNNKMPFSVTFTATPTSNGNVSYSFGQNVIVLSAWASVADMVVLPSSITGADTDGCSTWWFHVMSIFSSHRVITSNVTINCIYIKV